MPMAASAPSRRRAAEFVDEQGRRHPHRPSPQIEIDLEQKADDRPAEHGVGEAMADVAHAAQDDVHADQVRGAPTSNEASRARWKKA